MPYITALKAKGYKGQVMYGLALCPSLISWTQLPTLAACSITPCYISLLISGAHSSKF